MPSRVIRRFQYRRSDHALEVEFVSGRRYLYKDVPEPLYKEMRAAFSKGQYFNAHIKDRFAFERISSR